MIWQDMVLAFGGFFVAATLVPMLRAPVKPPASTSLPLTAILAAIAFALYTLDLCWAAAGTGIQCFLWGAMLVMASRGRARSAA
ncbi:MAG: hypothetical protein FJZ92_03065 [Chloroflexi bacterium]|nr:hypothetical protein [Chloroflexota bacterium]